jgi:protein-S-isoprenylcysteine O-methyltransferase Ste14
MVKIRILGYSLTTMLIYLGLILAGWGLDDLKGFFSLGPRLGYALLVAATGFAVGWQAYTSPEGIRGGRGRKEKTITRQSVIRVVVILMLYVGLWFVGYADRRGIATLGLADLIRWIGAGLFALGVGLVFWSGVALGRLYSGDVTLQERHHLVTDGPYRLMRHPRYSGGILLALGLSLTFDSWIGLIVSVVFVAIILFRIRDEEALMQREFGDEWDDYCKRTPRLVPFLFLFII